MKQIEDDYTECIKTNAYAMLLDPLDKYYSIISKICILGRETEHKFYQKNPDKTV
jgi:hypothetical protein